MTIVDAALPFLLLVAFLLAAARPARVRAAALAIPIAVAIVNLLAWLHERQPPATGDSQPGLVALVGVVATASCLVAVLLGWARHRVRGRRVG